MDPLALRLAKPHWDQMLAEVRRLAPLEACGLVAGQGRTSQEVFPVENVLESPVRYRLDPREQLRIFQLLDARDWNLLAIYHSHPHGPPTPSATDVEEAFYPEAVHLIWSPQEGHWGCRGFLIAAGTVREVPIQRIADAEQE